MKGEMGMSYQLSVRLASFIVCVGLATPALAQNTGAGSVRGYVKDEQGGVLPGAAVVVVANNGGVSRDATTDDAGFFRLLDLEPGQYTVRASLTGFRTYEREGVAVRAGLNLGLDIVLAVGGAQETVQVVAATPLLEDKSATVAVNVDGELQRDLPLSSRRYWSDFMRLVPGVASTELNEGSFYLHGADIDTHVTLIDGADMGSPQQAALLYTNLSVEAINDVQIQTGGAEASSPIGTGAVINLATASGTNTLRGAVATVFQGKRWYSNNNPGGTTSAAEIIQPEFSLGGPVVADRSWLFGSYRYLRTDSSVSRSASQLATLQAIQPGWAPFDARSEGHFYFVKSTTQLGPRHQVLASFQTDPIDKDSVGATSLTPGVYSTTGGSGITARLSSTWSSALISRVGVSYNDKHIEISTPQNAPERLIHGTAALSSGRLTGSGFLAVLDNGNTGLGTRAPYGKTTITADLTYFLTGLAGSHELQGGFYAQRLDQELYLVYANGGFVQEELVLVNAANLAGPRVPFHRRYMDNTEVRSTYGLTTDYAFYVQDTWRPITRLTITPGVRVDRLRRNDKQFGIVTQESVEVGPRLGANYALGVTDTVRATWGRIHEQPWIGGGAAGNTTAGFRDEYDNDLNGTFETVFVSPGSTALNPAIVFDPDLHQGYVDEWTAGYRRQLPAASSIDVGFVQRRTYTQARVDINSIFENRVFRGYVNESQNAISLLTNNDWNHRLYRGLELQFAHRHDGLSLIGSYTRQWFSDQGTWLPNDINGILQPSVFENDRGTGTPQWRDHILRMGSAWTAPYAITLAANYSYQSGPWQGPILTRLAAADPAFGPATVTLSNGRVVANPLATTTRFKNVTRGDGQTTLPGVHVFNVRVGREFTFDSARRVEVALNLFNLTNEGAPQTWLGGAAQDFNPNFGRGGNIQLPRTAQLYVRATF